MRFKDENGCHKGAKSQRGQLCARAPPTGPSICRLEACGLLGPDTDSLGLFQRQYL